MKFWTTVLAPTDISDTETNEPLYVYAKVRPAWYWRLQTLRLFFGIVWRPAYPPPDATFWQVHWTYALDIRTAWAVARG